MNLNYTDSKFRAGRDNAFLSHAYHICKSKKIQDMLKLFKNRTAYYDMDKNWRFYRVLSHWDSKGLIECERESTNGWRKFNLVEALWVLVMQKLRIRETSLETIQHIKSQFFEILDWDFPITLAEYYVIDNRIRAKNTKAGIYRAFKEGYYPYGCSPKGYKKDKGFTKTPLLIPNEHANLVKEAFELFATDAFLIEDIRSASWKNGLHLKRTQFGLLLRNPIYVEKF